MGPSGAGKVRFRVLHEQSFVVVVVVVVVVCVCVWHNLTFLFLFYWARTCVRRHSLAH